MGSGSKRKANDKPRINVPVVKKSAGGGSSGGGPRSGADINNVCPPGFEFMIKPPKPLPNKTTLTVKGKELFVFSVRVGEIPDRFMKIISECAGLDILYTGYILNRESKAYAHFDQHS